MDALLADWGEEHLASRLYETIPSNVPWQVVADLFAILIWSTSDNGHALTKETDAWLREGTDLRKVQIGLHLDTYPFRDRDEMGQVLTALQSRFPEVANRCFELIRSRHQLNE